MAKNGSGLNDRQWAAIAALLSCPTVKAAAIKARVGYRTLRGWLDQDEFRAALHDAERDRLDSINRRMLQLADKASDTLDSAMDGTAKGTQATAANIVLSRLLELRTMGDYEERIQRLEAQHVKN